MKYFKLNPNVSSKKWEGCLNPQAKLFDDTGIVSVISLSKETKKITNELFYKTLKDGITTSVNTIGSRFIAFDSEIENINSLAVAGVQLVPVKNTETQHVYFLMHLYNYVDCVNWDLSKVDLWPMDYIPEEWENIRGRFFITPVIISEKIPKKLDAFRLNEWGDAFNIIITDRLKDKILSLNFDHSFLEFHELTVV